jgi:hypothetical protein
MVTPPEETVNELTVGDVPNTNAPVPVSSVITPAIPDELDVPVTAPVPLPSKMPDSDVVPVPPLETLSVPPRVIAPVELELGVKPVDPPEKLFTGMVHVMVAVPPLMPLMPSTLLDEGADDGKMSVYEAVPPAARRLNVPDPLILGSKIMTSRCAVGRRFCAAVLSGQPPAINSSNARLL